MEMFTFYDTRHNNVYSLHADSIEESKAKLIFHLKGSDDWDEGTSEEAFLDNLVLTDELIMIID